MTTARSLQHRADVPRRFYAFTVIAAKWDEQVRQAVMVNLMHQGQQAT